MLIQVVYLNVKPSNLDTFIAEASANASESMKEPGVIRFDVIQRTDAPERFMLYEIYDSPEALEAHRQTVHFKRWLEKGIPLLDKPRERILYKPILIDNK